MTNHSHDERAFELYDLKVEIVAPSGRTGRRVGGGKHLQARATCAQCAEDIDEAGQSLRVSGAAC